MSWLRLKWETYDWSLSYRAEERLYYTIFALRCCMCRRFTWGCSGFTLWSGKCFLCGVCPECLPKIEGPVAEEE